MKYAILIVSLALFSCNQKKIIESKPDPMVKEMKCDNGTMMTLKKLNLDGCSWILESEGAEKFIPVNLNDYWDSEKAEGEYKVKVQYTITKTATACMVGETVALSCMEIVK